MRFVTFSFVCLVVASVAWSWSAAAKPADIPEEAYQAMQYRVGKWESVGFVDGVKQSKPGKETTEWVSGQYAIRIVGTFEDEGKDIHASGLIGWDPEAKQLIEHWYASDGSYATFRYTIDLQKQNGTGTCRWVYSDGRKYEGESVVQVKSPDEWEWNANVMLDGKKRTWRTINRRVK